jgi:hypothetical protein
MSSISHRSGRQTGILAAHQAQVGLIDQGRWLECLAGPELGRQRGGQAAQLRVHLRQQFRRSISSSVQSAVSPVMAICSRWRVISKENVAVVTMGRLHFQIVMSGSKRFACGPGFL